MARITGTEERNGVMYYTTDTGAIVPVKAVLQSQHPNVDFDDMGQAVGGVPSADNEIDPKPENVFGDVAAQYGNEELQSAKDLLRNAGNVAAQSLPEELGILRNVISYPTDLVNAGLLGALGAGQKAIALGAELMPGDTQSEKRLARDILGGADVAGVSPQGRMASALSAPAMTMAKQFAPDAIGLSRGILQLDPEMIGEVFQKGGAPKSLGAASPFNSTGLMMFQDQIGRNKQLNDLFTEYGFDPKDLSGADLSDLQNVLQRAVKQGTLEERTAHNYIRGLLR